MNTSRGVIRSHVIFRSSSHHLCIDDVIHLVQQLAEFGRSFQPHLQHHQQPLVGRHTSHHSLFKLT